MSQIWQVGTLHTGSYVFIILWTLIYFLAQDVLSSSYTYPTLESAFSPRSPISFKWGIVFKTKIWMLGIFIVLGVYRENVEVSLYHLSSLPKPLSRGNHCQQIDFCPLVSFLCVFIISSPSPHNYVCSGQFPVFT